MNNIISKKKKNPGNCFVVEAQVLDYNLYLCIEEPKTVSVGTKLTENSIFFHRKYFSTLCCLLSSLSFLRCVICFLELLNIKSFIFFLFQNVNIVRTVGRIWKCFNCLVS